jgi:hypothetical protein
MKYSLHKSLAVRVHPYNASGLSNKSSGIKKSLRIDEETDIRAKVKPMFPWVPDSLPILNK